MSLLDNNYDFDAIESMIDFKAKGSNPTDYALGIKDTAMFNLPKDVLYHYEEGDLMLFINLIDKKVLKDYITKLKEYYSIFSNIISEDYGNPFYNCFESYELKVSFTSDTIFISVVPDPDLPDHHPRFNFTLEDGRMTIRGALENAIFYNVLCEIEKGLDQVVYL